MAKEVWEACIVVTGFGGWTEKPGASETFAD
jgi:hypothetical protein